MIDQDGGQSFVFAGNVTDVQVCRAMVEKCVQTYGRLDILHNNVGVGQRPYGTLLEVDEAAWDRVIDTNMKSMFFACQAAVPQMLKQGSGAILNISSIAAVLHRPPLFIYSISKSGVNTFTRSLAYQLADKGIRVNAIMPGLINTPMIGDQKALHGGDRERMMRERAERAPMKRMGEAWDIAYAALFLVSEEAKYITGQLLAVDGGLQCKP